jgi:23S rRNA (cytosine1962-C5)-methyltransferase
VIPCVLFEDDDLLVIDKPAGVNTHAPSPYAGEGIYDWLRHREPRWATLAILHRLDKETSGVMVFGKTPQANRSLTEQFSEREVEKKYLLVTDRPVKRNAFTVRSEIARAGDKYVSRKGGEPAETHFRVLELRGSRTLLEAEPRTGRTHQIRVHAAESGFPILGDKLYNGTTAERVYLHAAELRFKHPATGTEQVFRSRMVFDVHLPHDAGRLSLERRAALIDPAETDAFRLIHGASDSWPGWHVDRLGEFLLSESEHPLTGEQIVQLGKWLELAGTRGAYHKVLTRHVRRTTTAEAAPQLVLGEAAPERFQVRENGVRFELSFSEGYSVGLFLDQRDNRRRFTEGHVAAGFSLPRESQPKPDVLNCFAYTCGFSVCAALGGARVTSLDLSKKYLEWGRRNFTLNGLDPEQHDFIYGDTFDWLRRLGKKGRMFDAVVLDPPTFSQSKESGIFRAEKDYGRLVTAAVQVLKPGGILLSSTNAADWPPEAFVDTVKTASVSAGRRTLQEHYVPQPLDFPITTAEPAYLKTLWLRLG